VLNGQSGQTLAGLLGEHSGPIVGQQSPGQTPLEEGLGQAVDQGLCRFCQIKLQMATQSGTVIKNGQGNRLLPASGRIEYFNSGLMIIEMPQGMDMGRFKTAYLTLFKPIGSATLSGGWSCRFAPPHPAVLLHAAADALVAGQWS